MNIFIRRQFGLSLDPWSEHYITTIDAERAAALVDLAVRNQALVSVFGQSGTGKTSAVEQALTATQALVVEVQRPERERVHLGDVMVALERDLTEERESARRSGEARAGQVRRLLGDTRRPVVLFIDDAHELHSSTLRGLKRLRELSWRGRKPLLGIVLVGETDRTATVPAVDRRTVKFGFSGLSVAEARSALQSVCGEALEASALERLAAASPARNWFDMQDLVDRALLQAAARGETVVSAVAAAAAIREAAGQSTKTVTVPGEQSAASNGEPLAHLLKATGS